jgi:hypothetical protein
LSHLLVNITVVIFLAVVQDTETKTVYYCKKYNIYNLWLKLRKGVAGTPALQGPAKGVALCCHVQGAVVAVAGLGWLPVHAGQWPWWWCQ